MDPISAASAAIASTTIASAAVASASVSATSYPTTTTLATTFTTTTTVIASTTIIDMGGVGRTRCLVLLSRGRCFRAASSAPRSPGAANASPPGAGA